MIKGQESFAHRYAPGVITVIALALAAARMRWSELNIDTITLALLLLAAVPWLGRFVEKIDLPGGGGVTLRDLAKEIVALDNRMNEVEGAAESADQKGDAALSAARLSAQSQSETVATGAPSKSDLVKQYDETRRLLKPGSDRTREMTKIVTQMIQQAPSWLGFDVEKALKAIGGERLAAYASLYAKPDQDLMEGLVLSLRESERDNPHKFVAQPFEQYWGLQALRQMVERTNGAGMPRAMRDQLLEFQDELKPGTDRHYELSQVLRLLGQTRR